MHRGAHKPDLSVYCKVNVPCLRSSWFVMFRNYLRSSIPETFNNLINMRSVSINVSKLFAVSFMIDCSYSSLAIGWAATHLKWTIQSFSVKGVTLGWLTQQMRTWATFYGKFTFHFSFEIHSFSPRRTAGIEPFISRLKALLPDVENKVSCTACILLHLPKQTNTVVGSGIAFQR